MPSTINYQPGDLLLVAFPFTSSGTGKPRPALVLLDTGDADVVLARVTTQFATTRFDVSLTEWKSAGLLAPSIVRLHKIASLEKSQVIRRLGVLEPADRAMVSAVVRGLFSGW